MWLIDVMGLSKKQVLFNICKGIGIPCAIMVQIACILHVWRHTQANVAVHDVEHRLVQQFERVTDIVCPHLRVWSYNRLEKMNMQARHKQLICVACTSTHTPDRYLPSIVNCHALLIASVARICTGAT